MKFLFFIALLCLINSVHCAYDVGMAKNFVAYAGASYCSPAKITAWSCSFCRDAPLSDPSVFYNPTTNMKGFVAYNPVTNSIIISFKGTDPTSITNWIQDLTFVSKPVPDWCDGCTFHTGFYDTYLSVRKDVIALLYKYLAKYPKAKLFVTGHSLGGAQATLCAYDIQKFRLANVTGVVTFGAPRVGNPTFVKNWDVIMNEVNNYRITHFQDPVPHLPLLLMGFQHSTREVYYGALNILYKVCKYPSEDPTCANSLPLNLLGAADHVTYLGFDFATNFLACKL